jgi:hypothetical protein
MNQKSLNTIFWGLLLLAIGVIGLLYNFGALDQYKLMTAYIIAGLLAAAGVGFLVIIVFQQERWLYAIPGASFLALGSVVYLTTLDAVAPVWLGVLFLAGIAAGFLILFLSNRRERWWALLQAGTIVTIGIAGLLVVQWMQPDASAFTAALLGAALFGGFAISFLLLYLFAGDRRKFAWALIMAGALAIFAAFLMAERFGESNVIVQIWPAVLILLGLLALARLFTGRAAADKRPPVTVPAEVLETKELGAGQGAEPARIVRPDQPADSAPSPEPAPLPAPAPISEPDDEPLPAEIATFDPDDPEAALDALLKASQE